MHDLRKKILLESGKTVSRKAKAKPELARSSAHPTPNASPGSSQPTSRANSGPSSRYASEDEDFSDFEGEDAMSMSIYSMSDDGADANQSEAWAMLLRDRIADLQDRKRSSVQGREAALRTYLHLSRHHYAESEVEGSITDLLPTLLKSIKSGGSAEEKCLAINALVVTLLTVPSDLRVGDMFATLKTAARHDEQEAIKITAIRALCVVVLYCSGIVSLAEELLDYLIEIVETDGEAVGAPDSGPVVTAATKAWVFVASQLNNIEEPAERAVEAFVEQLDSSVAEVQTTAGAAIAYLFEVARGDNIGENEAEDGDSDDKPESNLRLPYNEKTMAKRMSELGRYFSKSVPRNDRRRLKSRFASIVGSLEYGKGPGYQASSRPRVNPHTGGDQFEREFENGYHRLKIRVQDFVGSIDTWSKLSRVEFFRTVFQGGFATHFDENPLVSETLSDVRMHAIQFKPNARS